jgi:hypothetical protein
MHRAWPSLGQLRGERHRHPGRGQSAGSQSAGDLLIGTDLSKAILTKADLRRAIYDQATKWPDDFDPQAAGAILLEE